MTTGMISNTGDSGGGGVTSTAMSSSISTALSSATSQQTSLSTALLTAGQGVNVNIGAITGPTSGTVKMGGAAAAFTPTRSGKVLVLCTGTVGPTTTSVAAGDGMQMQLSWGTGVAPVLNAALTGTQFGTVNFYENGNTLTGTDGLYPFALAAVATGLTVGVAAWFDIAQAFVAGAGMEAQAVSFTFVEL